MPEPTHKERAAIILTSLLDSHWPGIIAAMDESEPKAVAVAISLKIGLNGMNRPTLKAQIAYGPGKTKDGVSVELDDPRQGKLTYDLKEAK